MPLGDDGGFETYDKFHSLSELHFPFFLRHTFIMYLVMFLQSVWPLSQTHNVFYLIIFVQSFMHGHSTKKFGVLEKISRYYVHGTRLSDPVIVNTLEIDSLLS